MRTRFSRRPSAGTVLAVVALFVALGGTAAAKVFITGANIKKHSLTGANIKNRSLTGANIANNSITGKQVKESSLAQVPSAQNATNATNATNAANASKLGGQSPGAFQRATRWALIAGTATGANVLAQSGGFSVTRFTTGFYVIDTGSSVVSKPLSATVNLTGGFGQVNVAPCGGTANNPGGVNCPVFNDNNHVEAETANAAGTALADRTFYISVGG
jgi:hypothetical protein